MLAPGGDVANDWVAVDFEVGVVAVFRAWPLGPRRPSREACAARVAECARGVRVVEIADDEATIKLALLSGVESCFETLHWRGVEGGSGVGVVAFRSGEELVFSEERILASSADEHVFHRGLVHPALALLPKKRGVRVLLVGFDDGAAARDCLAHGCVQDVCLCPRDEALVDCARAHYESAGALEASRVRVAAPPDFHAFLTNAPEGSFDVVFCDATDDNVDAPALARLAAGALAPGGLVAAYVGGGAAPADGDAALVDGGVARARKIADAVHGAALVYDLPAPNATWEASSSPGFVALVARDPPDRLSELGVLRIPKRVLACGACFGSDEPVLYARLAPALAEALAVAGCESARVLCDAAAPLLFERNRSGAFERGPYRAFLAPPRDRPSDEPPVNMCLERPDFDAPAPPRPSSALVAVPRRAAGQLFALADEGSPPTVADVPPRSPLLGLVDPGDAIVAMFADGDEVAAAAMTRSAFAAAFDRALAENPPWTVFLEIAKNHLTRRKSWSRPGPAALEATL